MKTLRESLEEILTEYHEAYLEIPFTTGKTLGERAIDAILQEIRKRIPEASMNFGEYGEGFNEAIDLIKERLK